MKKIIAIVMALVMMMAITVPAFAETIIDKDSAQQTAGADVVTTFDENESWSYTVTIPADMNIPWGDTEAKNMTYSVESQLLIGASLKIKVDAVDGGKMTAAGTTDTLTFVLTGGEEVTFAPVNVVNTTAPDVVGGENAKVQINDFSGAAVGEYTGTLTYTVEYVAPVTA